MIDPLVKKAIFQATILLLLFWAKKLPSLFNYIYHKIFQTHPKDVYGNLHWKS